MMKMKKDTVILTVPNGLHTIILLLCTDSARTERTVRYSTFDGSMDRYSSN